MNGRKHESRESIRCMCLLKFLDSCLLFNDSCLQLTPSKNRKFPNRWPCMRVNVFFLPLKFEEGNFFLHFLTDSTSHWCEDEKKTGPEFYLYVIELAFAQTSTICCCLVAAVVLCLLTDDMNGDDKINIGITCFRGFLFFKCLSFCVHFLDCF